MQIHSTILPKGQIKMLMNAVLSKKTYKNWLDLKDLYLENNLEKIRKLPKIDRERIELVKYFQNLETNNKLFHLTITYKPYADRNYKAIDVNRFFCKFYVQELLPIITGTKHYHRNKFRYLQPVCFSFVDDHFSNVVSVNNTVSAHQISTEYPARLHHHAILAVPEESVIRINDYIGENTFCNDNFSHKIMTSDFKECDATRVLYASKLMRRYPDFLSFPDKMKSTNYINNNKSIKEIMNQKTNLHLETDLHIRLPKALETEIVSIAASLQLTKSSFIRSLISQNLSQYNKNNRFFFS